MEADQGPIKYRPKRTEADEGRTLSVRLTDGFGHRTVKKFSKRTVTDGGQIPLVRLKDGFGRRTLKKILKADGSGRRTEPYRPPQGRIRTSDGKNF